MFVFVFGKGLTICSSSPRAHYVEKTCLELTDIQQPFPSSYWDQRPLPHIKLTFVLNFIYSKLSDVDNLG